MVLLGTWEEGTGSAGAGAEGAAEEVAEEEERAISLQLWVIGQTVTCLRNG